MKRSGPVFGDLIRVRLLEARGLYAEFDFFRVLLGRGMRVVIVPLVIGEMKVPGVGQGFELLGMNMTLVVMEPPFPGVGVHIVRMKVQKRGKEKIDSPEKHHGQRQARFPFQKSGQRHATTSLKTTFMDRGLYAFSIGYRKGFRAGKLPASSGKISIARELSASYPD